MTRFRLKGDLRQIDADERRRMVGVPTAVHGDHPNPMTDEQEEHLLEHLKEGFEKDTAAAAAMLKQIKHAHRYAAQSIEYEAWLKSERKKHPAKKASNGKSHFTKMAELARQLTGMLDLAEPHGPMSELTSRAGYSLDWSTTREHLQALASAADDEESPPTLKNRWRGDLIYMVAEIYGDAAKISDSSPFEYTINLLLQHLESHSGDAAAIHQHVLTALRKTR